MEKMEGMNFDEIQKQLSEAVKLENNDDDLTIKINIIADNLEENQMMSQMMSSEDQMKQQFGQFLGQEGALDCDITMNSEDKNIVIALKNKEDYEKLYELLNNLFFGDFFKKMMEAMMGAFGDMMGAFGDEE